jgi:hypothetical protein
MPKKTGRLWFALGVLGVAGAHFMLTANVMAAWAIGNLLSVFYRDMRPDPTVTLLSQVLLFPLPQIHAATPLPLEVRLPAAILISLVWGLTVCSVVRLLARRLWKSNEITDL